MLVYYAIVRPKYLTTRETRVPITELPSFKRFFVCFKNYSDKTERPAQRN